MQALSQSHLKYPVLSKFPVSNEYLAVRVGLGTASDYERQAFHDSIVKMIHNMALKYHTTTLRNVPLDDLVQECFMYLLRSLKTYDPQKSRLTTWTYYICHSVLNRVYRSEQKHWKENAELDETLSGVTGPDHGLKLQMRTVIQDVFKEFPDKLDILDVMFGNPFDSDYQCPDEIDCGGIARSIGKPYGNVYQFYRKKVCPFIMSRFGTETGEIA